MIPLSRMIAECSYTHVRMAINWYLINPFPFLQLPLSHNTLHSTTRERALPGKRTLEYAQAPNITCNRYTHRQRWAQPHRRSGAICWFGPTLRPKVHDAWSMQHPGRIQEILIPAHAVGSAGNATFQLIGCYLFYLPLISHHISEPNKRR